MTIHYNVKGEERKRLADYIAGFLGCEVKYLGVPSFAYQAGYIEVNRDGTITFDDRADSEEIETLLEELEAEGFHAAPAGDEDDTPDTDAKSETEPQDAPIGDEDATPDTNAKSETEPQDAPVGDEGDTPDTDAESETEPQDAPVGFTAEIPLEKVKVGNLLALLDAKGGLIRKALGIDALPIEIGETTVKFPWFAELPDPDETKAYTHLIAALCEMSRNQKRVTATEKTVDNEKYAFRCFLLRLGFIGEEYKAERKILLRHLTGSSAFKSGRKGGGADDAVSE